MVKLRPIADSIYGRVCIDHHHKIEIPNSCVGLIAASLFAIIQIVAQLWSNYDIVVEYTYMYMCGEPMFPVYWTLNTRIQLTSVALPNKTVL